MTARVGLIALIGAIGCMRVQTAAAHNPTPSATPRDSRSKERTNRAAGADARQIGVAYTPFNGSIALPPAPREFRGVWIATVGNMDWPSSPDASVAQQQKELLEMLDAAAKLNLNAIIFQVRPNADALYDSDIEPWSQVLTGQTGRAPVPYWDPLAFAIEQAHARGLELHAWFNPFRAGSTPNPSSDPRHITRARPDLVRAYAGMQWLDPGDPEVRDYVLRVIADVTQRYDIDAVHLDDYFYPYQEHDRSGRLIPFDDDATYTRFTDHGGTLTRADWRRNNINTFVHDLYTRVHAIKPWVKVGISPFGIWRPGYPDGVQGLDSYAEIFADTRTWLRNGWVDYMAPQLYWLSDAPHQPYTQLLGWWAEQNTQNRLLFAGNSPNSVRQRGWSAEEIARQVDLTRNTDGASGNIFFSIKALLQNRAGVTDLLKQNEYGDAALLPATPWLDAPAPVPPNATADLDPRERIVSIEWADLSASASTDPHASTPIHAYVLRTRINGTWTTQVLRPTQHNFAIAFDRAAPDLIAVSAVGRDGIESAPITLQLPAATPANEQ